MTVCLIEGCQKDAEVHHALRDRYPFNKMHSGSGRSGAWRERTDLVQSLCREHHFDTMHQLFAKTDNWPVGWGFADTPLLRGQDEVELMLVRAITRDTEASGRSWPTMAAGRQKAGGCANAFLYRLCTENPTHDDVGIVEAKIRLIGDHYRASLKRGIGKHHADSGDGFFVELARAVRSSDLDERLQNVRLEGRVSLRSLSLMVETHAALEATVVAFTRGWQGPQAGRRVLNRRSFCSKYLHFHAPEAFFIYDSVVLGRLGLRSTATYLEFADIVLGYALSGHSSGWTPRSVDMEIYGYKATGTD